MLLMLNCVSKEVHISILYNFLLAKYDFPKLFAVHLSCTLLCLSLQCFLKSSIYVVSVCTYCFPATCVVVIKYSKYISYCFMSLADGLFLGKISSLLAKKNGYSNIFNQINVRNLHERWHVSSSATSMCVARL